MRIRFFLFTLLAINTNICFSQDYIGKDFISAKNEIKKLFVQNGFTFLKEEKIKIYDSPNLKSSQSLLFKEEFVINLSNNKFENLSSYQIYTDRKDVIDKIKGLLNFSKWEYIGSKPDGTKEYKLKDLLISFSERPKDSTMRYSLFFYH